MSITKVRFSSNENPIFSFHFLIECSLNSCFFFRNTGIVEFRREGYAQKILKKLFLNTGTFCGFWGSFVDADRDPQIYILRFLIVF